ncbi:MAG: hypothetical protein RJR34_11315 [Candidatus Methanoculleus thermohydrogenotrophicum]|nr:hypothetical protein [Candidatus Methanoculleus thermohydrogenotrophicum]
MAKDLDDQVQASSCGRSNRLSSYLFVDASYYKIRDGARYVTQGGPGGRRSARGWLPGDLGRESHRL